MTARIIGNAAVGNNGPMNGTGGVGQRAPFGHITVAGSAGDTARIPASYLYPKTATMFQGIYAQMVGTGPVTIQTSLVSPDVGLDPAHDAAGHWNTAQSLTTSAITKVTNPATCLLITFTGAGVLNLIGV
jgi:hypothetical protein